MAKSKSETPAQASPAVTNGQQNGQKKKKKNDPLRPQPAWLFPPDDENPVLNPKAKSEEQVENETKERLDAINFLEHRSVTAPVKEPPPGLLLQLVGAFLTSYGFSHTGRIFTTERKARKKIKGWNDELNKKFEKNTPTLVSIFKRWQREWELEQAEAKAAKGDETSEDEDDSDSSEAEEDPKKTVKKSTKAAKSSKDDSDSDSSSSGSDSDDTDDEKPAPAAKSSKKAAATAAGVKKRKASETESDSDSSSDDSSDDSDAPAKKRKVETDGKGGKKVTTTQLLNGMKTKETVKTTPGKVEKATITKPASESDNSSSDSDTDSSDDDDDDDEDEKPNGVTVAANGSRESTDSTNTLNGDAKKAASSDSDSSDSSSSSDDDASPAKTVSVQKRKRSKSPAETVHPVAAVKLAKKTNEPFSRIPKDQHVDPRLSSNRYVPYDYAQRAHEDLIVTKGKGFTKEKNKKKRGSYRGGAIDLGGGKGIKFDD